MKSLTGLGKKIDYVLADLVYIFIFYIVSTTHNIFLIFLLIFYTKIRLYVEKIKKSWKKKLNFIIHLINKI